jgi:hypothetical protein
MTKMTRKLMLAVLTVVVTLVTLGTTTFAWFTLTNTSVIQGFDANIIADSGIEIALANFGTDPEDLVWKTTLTKDDVETYLASSSFAAFDSVTSQDGRIFYQKGEDSATGVGSLGASTTAGVVSLPIHFRSANATEIFWSDVTLTSGVQNWRAPIAFTDSKGNNWILGDQVPTDAADAMRVSVTGSNLLGDPITVVYQNGNSDTNTVLAQHTNVDFTVAPYVNGALSYYHAITALYPGSSKTVTTANAVTTLITDNTDPLNPEYSKVLDMTSGNEATYGQSYYGRITVRIWFEGWDQEAYNALLSRMITTSFRFVA